MMVRAALSSSRRIGQGPRTGATIVPAASVVVGSAFAALPIVSNSGWFPDMGFLVLIAWRLLRADAWPAWWAAPLGLANDLITGSPIGLSVAWWTAAMIALDIVDRRTLWRDYWIEWALAAVLLLINEAAEWQTAALMGAAFPFAAALPPLAIATLCFPIAARLVGWIDQWRLGK